MSFLWSALVCSRKSRSNWAPLAEDRFLFRLLPVRGLASFRSGIAQTCAGLLSGRNYHLIGTRMILDQLICVGTDFTRRGFCIRNLASRDLLQIGLMYPLERIAALVLLLDTSGGGT